jgi:hypothetical protein
MKLTRVMHKILQAKKPSFILSKEFFCLKSTPLIAFHKRLFFLSCQHPVSLLINLQAYIRWLTYYAWVASYQGCQRQTSKQLKENGLSRPVLFFKLLKMSLVHVVPPYYYFKYQLNRNENAVFNYFYQQQLPYFHHHCNQYFKSYKQAVTLIGDKHSFSLALQRLGLPTCVGLCYETKNIKQNVSILLRKQRVFCKPNNASQSQDAFLIDYNANQERHIIEPIHGPTITQSSDIISYLQNICRRHSKLLVQPFLQDHRDLKKLSNQRGASTIRIITGKKTETTPPELLYLQLEVPHVRSNNMQLYTIIPLDIHTLSLPNQRMSVGIKKWLRESIHYCLLAHQHLLNLSSVSFDVIIGEQGPIIIEANFNWSIELLYSVINVDDKTHPAYEWLQAMIKGMP